nr:hypothetical protein [Desulforamulus aquiferis]
MLEEGMRIFFLDQATLDQLNIPLEELDHIAKSNFFRDLAKPMQLFDQQRKIFGFNYGDSYDSSRLLAILTASREGTLPKDSHWLVMIPNRDVVLLFTNNNSAHTRQAIMIGQSSFINNPYPISSTVFKLHKGNLEIFKGL